MYSRMLRESTVCERARERACSARSIRGRKFTWKRGGFAGLQLANDKPRTGERRDERVFLERDEHHRDEEARETRVFQASRVDRDH